MNVYRSKYGKLPGTSYAELMRAARREYHAIQKRTPRRKAYVRSKYFKQDKVFLDAFWLHLNQKNLGDKERRVGLYRCAVDLMRHSNQAPTVIVRQRSKLYRFSGQTKDGQWFYVQISENLRSGRKDFMSVFPA